MQTISSGERCNLETPTGQKSEASVLDHDSPVSFHSILFEGPSPASLDDEAKPPTFFRDLNLDQIVDAVTRGKEEYRLKSFFYTRPTCLDAIIYRQEIMRELEKRTLFESIKLFSGRMRKMRLHLTAAQNWQYKYSKERWLLEAVETYCEGVIEFQRNLKLGNILSRGLCHFRDYLAQYIQSVEFKTFYRSAKEVKAALSVIRYSIIIKGGSVTVRPYDSEIDYSTVVEETFARFKRGAVKDYRQRSIVSSGMNHVEAAILERVARLYPDAFKALDDFCAKYPGYLDKTIAVFDREIQFYIAYLEYAERFKRANLKFCYPQVSDTNKEVYDRDSFDLALAGKLISENLPVVCNDFSLTRNERIFVVTGPNQGGKTTFARTFGQLHYLASLGCPVPGSEARLFLFDRIFTHFEREEDITTLRGKMQDDLVRIHQICEDTTSKSIVIINEIFSSTSVKDGVQLGKKIVELLSDLDALCVCVTFLDELASFNKKTVSMVAAIVPGNPSQRTYKVERRPADGLAHALAIAEKYRLTYGCLKERLKP